MIKQLLLMNILIKLHITLKSLSQRFFFCGAAGEMLSIFGEDF